MADAIRDDVGTSILAGLMGIWLARRISVYAACREVHSALTPLSEGWLRTIADWTQTEEGLGAVSLEAHVDAFMASFADLEDEGRELAGRDISENGLLTLLDWIDWQCSIAETYARGKAQDHGMPAHIGTLAAAVIRGALRDEATARYVAAHGGITTLQ
ncbi:hypothetical protein [Aureimonas leprariae]|uniref:Uncharacterized protein n=1 Tax=Plantimonas leprariae TaxID=2615207 RepID=A0A7V7PPV0_9HYPH|nr:hypothetical protein [Aureimonas leprariae]KAB0680079.1 hypothetical protein F6X38_09725 [Aureimonas leprariae]